MPRVPVPPGVDEFLRRPNPAVLATVRPDGSPHTAATWYDWEDGVALLVMYDSAARLSWMRPGGGAALTVLDAESWYRHVTLLGPIVRLEEDSGLAVLDRLARRYTGEPHTVRDRRCIAARLEPESWYRFSAP